jgi:putative transposase
LLTLKKILFAKLPGGVPFDPALMRKLGLDPRKTAAITLSKLEEFIYEAIYELYHQERHSGIGRPPLLVWRKGLANGAREIVDDIGFLSAAFGVVDDATLSRQGIRFRKMTFHDPEITTQLLTDLAGTTPVRKRRKRTSSATARVKIKYNPADIRGIYVWNPRQKPKRGYVFLPNWDEDYASTPGLGFWHNDRIQEFAEAESLEFRSDEDKCLARDRLRARIEAEAPGLKFAAIRAKRRLLEPPKPVLKGDTVLYVEGIPSASGLKGNDVVVSIAAHERGDEGRPEKGPRRGGAKAIRTAKKTREAKQTQRAQAGAASTEEHQPKRTRSQDPLKPRTRALTVTRPAEFMADLAKRMASAQRR